MTEQNNKAKAEKAAGKTVAAEKSAAKSKKKASDKAADKSSGHKPPAKPKQPVAKSGGKGLAMLVAGLALLIAIASAAGGYYLWLQQQASVEARQQVVQEMTARALSRQQALQASFDKQNEQLETRLNLEKSARVELEKSLEQLRTELGRDRSAWTLAEVRYYLRLANTRLLLLADVPSALRALELADARLKALASPAVHKLRALLNEEISALKAVPSPDIEGASLRLIALTGQVEALPIVAPARSKTLADAKAATAAPMDIWDWRGHARALWAELKTLITIRRTDRPVDALLPPEQMVFLRHNLRLKLEAARLALLQKDTDVFQASLTEAADWIKAYFDSDAPAVKSLLEQLAALAELELQPALPDISRSLAAVEALEEEQAKANGGN